MENFSCYIIGDDYLLIECGKVLLDKRWIVRGVVSSYDKAIDWARNFNIPIFQTINQFEEVISKNKFDYLFSISNKKIIPISILNRAKRLAINYHNAPLPKYPGVYATTWAILNKEKEHGVSWHVITEKVDEGDILAQENFPIHSNDTMLTLNTRCHEKALVLFKKLVLDLMNNAVQRIKQVEKNKYYSLEEKAKNDGLIYWNQPAEEVLKLCRALCSYPKINHVGSPTFMIEKDVFIPKTITITSCISTHIPGVIATLNKKCLQISTTTKDIKIQKILNMDGSKCSIDNLVNKYNLKSGYKLKQFDKKFGQSLEQLSRDNYKNEIYWVKKLQEYYPAQVLIFPKSRYKNVPSIIAYTHTLKTESKNRLKTLCKRHGLHFDKFLLTALLAYIYRINSYECFIYRDKICNKVR